MNTALAAGCLVLAALVVAWPGSARTRLRRVFAAASPTSSGGPAGPAGSTGRLASAWQALTRVNRYAAAGGTVVVAALVALAFMLGGPVAAVATGAYGALAVVMRRRQVRRQGEATRRRQQLDRLGAAAADLRAGLPATVALPHGEVERGNAAAGATAGHFAGGAAGHAAGGAAGRSVLDDRMRAATVLAERTGAPLADLLDRVEADARAGDRARAAAAAQAAGAQATAWLLAGLPAGGLALGYAVGADPLQVLLHTPIGAACAFGAIILQLAGVVWSRRLLRTDGAAA